jgi:hypothetical protein
VLDELPEDTSMRGSKLPIRGDVPQPAFLADTCVLAPRTRFLNLD